MYNDDEITLGKIAKWAFIVLIVCLALDWVYAGQSFFLYKFFAPREEAVRREVYEHTKSYHQGNIQRLNTLCSQVATTDDDHKSLINDIINQEFAEWDLADVPPYLHVCLNTARATR